MLKRISHFATAALVFANAAYGADEPIIDEVKPIARCSYNAIVADTSGSYFAIWQDDQRNVLEPSQYLFPNTVRVVDKKLQKQYLLRGSKRVQPLYWKDGHIYFRYGDKNIYRADGYKTSLVESLPEISGKVRFRSKSIWNIEATDIKSIITKIDDSSNLFSRYFIYGNTGTLGGIPREKGIKLVNLEDGKNITEYAAMYYRDLHIIKGADNGFQYSYLGKNGFAYKTPIIDYITGDFSFTYNTFDSTYIDGSAITLNGNTYYLSKTPDGGNSLTIIGSITRSSEKVCERFELSGKVQQALNQPITADSEIVKLVSRTSAVKGAGLLTRGERSRGDSLIIYLHGGPTVSALDENAGLIRDRLVLPTYDILMIDYPGSIGLGDEVSDLFSKKGPRIFDEYAETVNRWVSKAGYKKVLIISQSFGSLPAVSLMKRMNRSLEGTIFFAPLLSKNPIDLNDPAKNGVSSLDQILYDEVVYDKFGTNNYIKNWINKKFADNGCIKCIFIFGDRDFISRKIDLSDSLKKNSIEINSEHSFIMANEKGWAFVKQMIGIGNTKENK